MTKWTTIKLRKRTKAQAESNKKEDETWDEYMRRCNPETKTDTDIDREFCDLEDLTIDADTLYGRIDDLETEIKVKIEQETRR